MNNELNTFLALDKYAIIYRQRIINNKIVVFQIFTYRKKTFSDKF